jgi:drug/metabolite transporter (DMT)-like permease
MERHDSPDRLAVAAFSGAVLIGGANFVAVKWSNAELDPLYGAALRFTGAAVLFWLLAAVLRPARPGGRVLLGSALYGMLGFGAAYGLLYFALLEISIGMAAVIMATVPLFALALAVLHGQERVTAGGLIGGFLAIVGIAVLSWRALDGQLSIIRIVAAVAGAAAAAEALVVVKRFPGSHPVTTNAVGMAAGSVLLWAASSIVGERWKVPQQAPTWAAVSWLWVAGSVGMFYLLIFVIERWTASATTYAMSSRAGRRPGRRASPARDSRGCKLGGRSGLRRRRSPAG